MLIVEDEEGVASLIEQAAAEAGYSPTVVTDGLAALERASSSEFSVILLDVMLPFIDGFEVCRQLRRRHIDTPILMITARDTLDDKIEGLDSGADDYIVKPFQLRELLARMRALLRRRSSAEGPLRVGDLVLDPIARRTTRGGKSIHLSATEYALLEALMRGAGQALTRAYLLDQVWQYDFGGHDNVLDVYISYLRAKIDKGRGVPLIHTVRGVGYRIGE